MQKCSPWPNDMWSRTLARQGSNTSASSKRDELAVRRRVDDPHVIAFRNRHAAHFDVDSGLTKQPADRRFEPERLFDHAVHERTISTGSACRSASTAK